MEFAEPLAFLLALLAVPLLLLLVRHPRHGYLVASTTAVRALPRTLRQRAARALPLLRVAAVILLVVAIARPRVGEAETVVPGQGIDIALSFDVSSSMKTGEFGSGKNRLVASKEVIREFIRARENDRIGVVVFQRDALPLSPPTLDYAALDRIIADVDSGIMPDGTGIGVGLASALNMLRDSTAASRIVILLTDGQHNVPSISPEEAANLAKSLRIRVYTIGILSSESEESTFEVDEPRLQAIAEMTGGRYFPAQNQAALADVYAEIGRLETSAVGRERFERYTEYAPWFLGAAAALMAVDLVLRATWLRRGPA
ncbi:MAG: VWA domain-containing protein [Dehalococcoidia bacterium]|nr:VWA domain-containing protein [Dehalococcoidia bacterium]